ncbi:sensor histidine kinase [Streptomyces sp. NBC_01381]|uniref:sensor histidine kinase n=1 Tax=Streptomyces sp. NBC_01381 TaxID=2903845 RepID=UPI00225B8C75|nr:sensor histidine kinase [Streptomyces sp. NBC_01381]MCX4668319.1 sensor histidine kinase [Streptomyces sp. NBC_01381]
MDIEAGQAAPEQGRGPRVAGRLWPPVRTGLAWSGAVVYPCVTYVTFDHGQQGFDALMVLASIALTAVVVSLLRRRPLPALVFLLLGAVTATMEMRKTEVSYLQIFVGVCAVGYLAATRPRRTSVAAALMAFTAQLLSLFAFPPDGGCDPTAGAPPQGMVNGCAPSGWVSNNGETVAFIAVALIAAWMVGSSSRERRAHAEALRSQATARAITAERLRIARELHDMIAHSIGVIAIQAGVGSRVIETQPAEARNALTTIENTSRETLAGLRRTLVALRKPESDDAMDAELASDRDDLTPREPTPGLADIDRLVTSALDAGVRVEVRWPGERGPLPADIDLAAFRILQEALTNVVRHAGTDTCRVKVDRRAAELSIEIEDGGRGGLPAGTGFGLVGMRERVALLHGRFTAGPRPEGGFRVAALLPVPEEGR